MENIKGIVAAGAMKEEEESDVDSEGSGDEGEAEGELESGEDEEMSESEDEPPPPPPPPPPRRPPVRSNKKHNAIIRRIPHRDFLKQKRKSDALKEFHKFSKKMKLDTGLSIKTIAGGDIVELDELLSDSDESFTQDHSESSDGFSDPEFTIDPEAGLEPDQGNESFIDPETGAITIPGQEPELPPPVPIPDEPVNPEPTEDSQNKTLSISDIINEGSEFDLSKNVDIEEILGANQFTIEKRNPPIDGSGVALGAQEGDDTEYHITEKLKEMGEISVKPVKKVEEEKREETSQENKSGDAGSSTASSEDDKNKSNALNVRRNIREVMDEKQLDASTLAAQRQESERLARVQEQQRIIREVRRQIALGRQEKHGASMLKGANLSKLNLPGTVLVKLPSGEVKKAAGKPGQADILKMQKSKGNLTPSVSIAPVGMKPVDIKREPGTVVKKEVVEIVDSSSSSSSSESPSSDSDDCIMLSDSELPPSPEPDEDPQNSGLHVNDAYNIPDEQGRVVINIGHPENEEDIFLAPQIGRIIKPHQIGGVRFLFDNIIESVERFSTSTGFGCILAHSMGLGKTLQIVCFCDIFLRHTNSKTVLCIMPINTLQNWVAEFNMWLPLDASASPLLSHGEVRPRNFPIYVLNDSHKTLEARAKVIKEWSSVGGVLMIGYELYRLLSLKKNKKPRNRKKKTDPPDVTPKVPDSKEKSGDIKDGDNKGDVDGKKPGSATSPNPDGTKPDEKTKEEDGVKNGEKEGEKPEEEEDSDLEKKLLDEVFVALVKPGPDLVICDEGHRIKNSHSNISYALKQMRTKRRIVLTGYPLQNNLLEYWCMVDFVRPNYLGTKTEFSNMFERPIQNGQCIDSTPQDIRLMRYRAHVLHSLLLGFVQRRSHAVLQSTLPQKEEYVLLVRLTDLQRKLYDTFMNEVVRKKTVPNPLKAFAVCCKIWNHPDVLYYFLKNRSEMAAMIDYDLDIEDNPAMAAAAAAAAKKNNPIIRKGKPRARAPPKKANDKTPLAPNSTNSGKPAATIPPNTSNANPVPDYNNAYDPSKGPHPNGPHQYGYGGDVNQPPNTYPPYGYQQYPPHQNYYGPNDSYGQQPYNSGYYPPQPYTGEYNQHYPPNSQDPSNPNIPPHPPQPNMPNYPQNPPYNHQGYWGPDNTYYNNPAPNYYPNANQNPPAYPNSQEAYPPVYDPYAQQTQPYGYNPNRPYDNRNIPNGEHAQPPYNADPNVTYPPPVPSSVPPISTYVDNASISSVPPTYDNVYPGYSNIPPTAPIVPEKPVEVESPSWPIPPEDDINKRLVNSVNSFNNIDIKNETKTDSDGEFKIADLDTMKVINNVKSEIKKEIKEEIKEEKPIIDTKKEEVKDETPEKSPNAKSKNKTENKPVNKSKVSPDKSKAKDDKDKNKKAKDKSKTKDKKGGKKPSEKGKDDEESGKESDDEKKDKDEKPPEVKEEVPYEWANEILKAYMPGIIENSAKMEIFFCILQESIKLGDRLLLFSQSLFTLNLIEDYLQRNYITGSEVLWAKNKSYYRLDGSTSALEREKLINEFNSNPNIHLFLVSTRAGSLGINLVGANRVIVFDASWNPCHDTQAVCRVYRYGQKKPCFVYRLVMDCCLEKKIYDRQINKQGMSDRVVDECNPDAVLSMKEVTNLCWDNEEKETEAKEFEKDCKDKYLDVVMRKIIEEHSRTLSKEPFQHESLLVDRKEKKLSSAEKRLAQRGYELEKKAAANPKPSLMYRTIRTADGTIIQRPVASVRPMQHGGSGGARWIPAEVWQRQGMTAQEMTLPLDVVIPTNSAEKTNIVLKAGQRVMVLKSPKGIYMQLESGKIIAIKTSFKVGQKPGENVAAKDGPNVLIKKGLPNRPSNVNLPGSLKNNSAITVISKSARGGLQKVMTRPNILQNKVGGTVRPFLPGGLGRIQEMKVRPSTTANATSIIRARQAIVPRPPRPIPIQNKLNIKIQGTQQPLTSTTAVTDIQNKSKEDTDPEPESSTNNSSKVAKVVVENNESKSRPASVNKNESTDDFEEQAAPNKVLQPTLPEDVVSEDSSQEKTYVDLSDKSESKITTKPSTKRPLVKPPPTSMMKDCKIPIKNSFLQNESVQMGFMNQVTIKRTTVPAIPSPIPSSLPVQAPESTSNKPAPVNLMADEIFPSEATLSEHKLPTAQNSAVTSADENSMEEDMMVKEKKIYKPNLVDRKVKINSLKNYRHQRPLQKPIPIQSADFNIGKMSPASSSSTPTPPPVAAGIPIAKTTPDKFESSLSQLEKTATSITRITKPGAMSDFQQSLNDITRTYSPIATDSLPAEPVYKPGPKSRKKKPPQPESPDNTEMLSTPIPIDTSLTKPVLQAASGNATPIVGSQPVPFPVPPSVPAVPPPHAPGYEGSTGLSAGFSDPAYHQGAPPAPVDPAAPPAQPYNAYPGYPSGSAPYPPYPPAPAPYYQGYPPAPYPPYPPQYPPYAPNPYNAPPYAPYPPNPNPHQW